MALNKGALMAGIKGALDAAATMEEGAAAARVMLADQIATAIDTYVRAAVVNPGIPVSTTGSATAHTGATTGTGTLS
jgi:hypothetical protein